MMISYSHALEEWTKLFYQDLLAMFESFIPGHQEIFYDKNSLSRTKNLTNELRYAVENSSVLIVILSQPYLLSEWCSKELDWFDDMKTLCERGNLFVVRAMSQNHINALIEKSNPQIKERFEKFFELDSVGYEFFIDAKNNKFSFPLCWSGKTDTEQLSRYDHLMRTLVSDIATYLDDNDAIENTNEKQVQASGQSNSVILSPLLYLKNEQLWQDKSRQLIDKNIPVLPAPESLVSLKNEIKKSEESALKLGEFYQDLLKQNPTATCVQYLPTADHHFDIKTSQESINIELSEISKFLGTPVRVLFSLAHEIAVFSKYENLNYIWVDDAVKSQKIANCGGLNELLNFLKVDVSTKRLKSEVSIDYSVYDEKEQNYFSQVQRQLYRKFQDQISVKGLSTKDVWRECSSKYINDKKLTQEDVYDDLVFNQLKQSDYLLFIAGNRPAIEIDANFDEYEKLWREKCGDSLTSKQKGAFLIWKDSGAQKFQLSEYNFFPYGPFDNKNKLSEQKDFQKFLTDLDKRIYQQQTSSAIN